MRYDVLNCFQLFHLLCNFWRPFPTSVCLPVEIGKQKEVKAAVAQNDPTVNLNVFSLYSLACNKLLKSHLGIVAVYEERLDGVQYEDEELEHLQLGEDVFPAKVGLESRTQC